ncbi:MAG TPA: hypothetical protein VHJ34_13345 [Actinomycetota bacterium]|nr:hypothetical protein [Actinomycetota bacterium]
MGTSDADPPQAGQPPDDDRSAALEKTSDWLIGSFSIVAAVLAALGLSNAASLERLYLNNPIAAPLGFMLVVTAIVAALIASRGFLQRRHTKARITLILASIAFFGGGLVVLTYHAARTPSERLRPRVAAHLDIEGKRLVGTVEASSVKSKETFIVQVRGFGPDQPRDGDPLYWSRTGSNTNGVVEIPIEVPLAVGTYNWIVVHGQVGEAKESACTPKVLESGCVSVRIPELPNGPRVSAAWADTAKPVLIAKVSSGTLEPNGRMAVRVLGESAGGRSRQVYSASVPPDEFGAIENELRVPVDRSFSAVCLAARVQQEVRDTKAFRGCSPRLRHDDAAAWVELRVPKG